MAAQDDQDLPVTATHVTGEAISDRTISQGVWTELAGSDQSRDAVFEHDVEWSDPRLPSLMRINENLNIYYPAEDGGAWSWVGSIRLEGDQGAWTGMEYGLGTDSNEGIVVQPRMMLLTGEGAYEGLSAMIQHQYEVVTTASRPVFEGYILEGELPPMPDPVQPSVQ